MARKEPRYTVRFNDGEHESAHPLPYDRAMRIALHGLGDHGRFKGGHADIINEQGYVEMSVSLVPA